MAKKEKKELTLDTQNLYAKYIPKVMEDFVGQESAVATFEGWIKTGKFPSTILISGLTGSGKTTFAKLIERYINCEKLKACGKCRMCKQEERLNLSVTNAVSDGKIDNMRNLINVAGYAPTSGRKRVIVIDEVHALQKQSEESLLVPIENPSKNTVWIFCTTDPDSLRATLRNRCAKININPIEPDVIADRLYSIAKAEKLKIRDKKATKKALLLIGEYSDGQMRNGISLFQSLIGVISSGEKLSEATLLQHVTEAEGQGDLLAAQLFLAMVSYNLFDTIKIINSTKDVRGLVAKLQYLVDWFVQYQVGAVKYTPNSGKILAQETKKLKGDAKKQYDKTMKNGLPFFVNIQDVCLEIIRTLNTVSIPEKSLAQTWLAKAVAADYEFTVKR